MDFGDLRPLPLQTASRPSLDAPEIKRRPDGPTGYAPPDPSPLTDVGFRHAGWLPRRRRTMAALYRAGIPCEAIARFAQCGSRAWVYQATDEPGLYSIRSRTCHSRWCVPCQVARSNLIARNLRRLVDPTRTRFVTLTLKHNDQPLAAQLDRLYRSFARLRARKIWKSTQQGGIAFLEISRNAKSNHWHPHLHIITTGAFLPVARLREAWLSVTRDSHIVDIRWVRSADNAASYVAKYATKSVPNSVLADPAAFAQAVAALAGRRTYLTWGTWRGVILAAPHDDEPHDWQPLCTLERLIERSRLHDDHAASVLASLCKSAASVLERDKSPPAARSQSDNGEPLAFRLLDADVQQIYD